ncbi:DUF4251 domain-containing protein [Reichenbachiella ulvae]|uniref:DUF4251 domain-containing protein n=1 Tax=Reichenbachiella ulvae TaxID=2980104 RepID=A0ABT3CVH3_9BACT|nr:DUF4251 domain-containing protein [Reichenbachiella ulvae]MCV9387534.1 DUF4251 domain-containing protein [Reichenbachiella ulvae]
MRSLLIIFALLLLTAFAVLAQDKQSKRAAKKEAEAKKYALTKEILESGEYYFVADWATTQKGRRINLISNPNQFKISDQKAEASMPYFGAVQMYDMSGQGGINIEGPVENYEVKYNEKKNRITVTFKARSSTGNETYACTFNMGATGGTSLSITSGARNRISYSGQIKALSDTNPKE